MDTATKVIDSAINLRDLPLCVDMDGTLVRVDTLHEALVAACFADWRLLFKIPFWLAHSKERLKQEIARRWEFDAAKLPQNKTFINYLAAERAAGRHIILCTASHYLVAERVAESFDLFDSVIASGNETNLRGPAKAKALCDRFGSGGYVYAGNDKTDHAVWDSAAGAIVVDASPSVRREAISRHNVIQTFDARVGKLRATIKALRPHQWVKNALCLVPPAAALDFTHPEAWIGAVGIALAFCMVASGIYLINDISDLAADRAHARKSRRPFASGDLPISVGLALFPTLLLAGLLVGWSSGGLPAVALYVVSALSYQRLKTRPLVDVFLLAWLYTVRLFGGGEASGHPVSLWLMGFSSFLFLSLALVKRVSELQKVASTSPEGRIMRRGYMAADIPILQMFGCAATFASAIVLSLYVQSDSALGAYHHRTLLLGWIPLLLFWQCRLWLATVRGHMLDDPIVYAARDWVSWILFACIGVVGAASWWPFTVPIPV